MAEILRVESFLSSREKILEAARQLFAEKGFGETSVDEIAERAGVAKGTIYTHFSSKDELLVTILRIGTNELTQRIHELMRQEKPFLERLKDVTRVFLEYVDHHHHFHRVYSMQKEMLPAPVPQNPEIRRELYQQYRNFHAVLTVYMQEGIDNGFIRSTSAEEAAFYFSSILGASVYYYNYYNYYNNLRPGEKNVVEMAGHVFDLFMNGFGAKKVNR